MELVRFFAFIIKIAIVLALAGQLKSCTYELMGLAAQKSERGMISYKKYTETLLKR
jgi:FlaG/FlaF family flagellin (archaellin)